MRTSPLISEEQIKKRVAVLGQQISQDLADEKEIVCLCILRGAFVFFSDLVREINNDLQCEFIKISSYCGNEQVTNPTLTTSLPENLEGKTVLVIEDIIDSGKTINFLIEELHKQKVKQVKVAALLNKESNRVAPFTADYIGFEVKDEFVIGYGLDWHGLLRNLPYVGVASSKPSQHN